MSQNLKKSLYYSPWIFPKNGSEITKNFYYIFLYILMYLCYVASLSQFRLQFFKLWSFYKNFKNLKKSPMDFSKKWVRNHKKILLHFLIHIDVLMLCRKFELILASIFRVMAFLRKLQKSGKIPVL